jgi:hypothetical protein
VEDRSSRGHASCFYWVLDTDSGKEKMMGGFDFLWSHDRKWVAHRHVRMNDDDAGSLMFNHDDIAYPPVDRKRHFFPSRDIGALTWSPDDKWVSFCETEYPGNNGYIVLVGPQGNFLRAPLPEGVEYSGKIEWTDSYHFQINTFGTKGHLVPYKFVVDGSTLREIVEHAKEDSPQASILCLYEQTAGRSAHPPKRRTRSG